MIKIRIFPSGSSDVEISDFINKVDLLEFLSDGGAVSNMYQMAPNGDMVFKYMEKDVGMTKEYHVERLKEQIQSLQARRLQAGLNLKHATAVDKAHRGGKIKQIKAAENLSKAETDLANIDFDLSSKRGLLADVEKFGFNEAGDINIPVEVEKLPLAAEGQE